MLIAGVMSGSSLDGLDVALVSFEQEGQWSIVDTYARKYPADWVGKLKKYHLCTALQYIELKYQYSYLIGNMLNDILSANSHQVDLVSFHGHTLTHNPESGYTEQIGNGGIISALTKTSVITDFRNADIASGGVGTPIAPIADQELFPGYRYYLNLGGIANITSIKSGEISAYDICPCNQILNFYANRLGEEFDRSGKLAYSGQYISEIEHYLNNIVYFKSPSPKSLDNNWIRTEFLPNIPEADPKDVLHTYTNWMAHCIADQVKREDSQSKLLATGGGAHNIYFIDQLTKALDVKNCQVVVPSKNIVDNKEAILMALMGYKYLVHQPNVLGQVTGADIDTLGGALHKWI